MRHSLAEKLDYTIATHVYVAMHLLSFFDSRHKKNPASSLDEFFSEFKREMPTSQEKVFDAGVFILFLQFACVHFQGCFERKAALRPISEVVAFNGINISMPVGVFNVETVIRRMRNSLAHKRFELEGSRIVLNDLNIRNPNDTFRLVATYEQLWEVVKYMFRCYVVWYNEKGSSAKQKNS